MDTNKLIFSDEDFNTLSNYELVFQNAVNHGYCRLNILKDMKILDELFKKYNDGKDSGILGACGRCLLNGVKKLGVQYFKDKEERSKVVEETPVSEKTFSEESKPKPKKKSPKKSNKK